MGNEDGGQLKKRREERRGQERRREGKNERMKTAVWGEENICGEIECGGKR
jgi:hypothetical protein